MANNGNERSEVQGEVTFLREDERLRILEGATEKMRKEAAVDSNLDLGVIAARTKNYNRGELELLVRLAQGNALSAQLLRTGGFPTTDGLKLTMGDFTSAMGNVNPASGSRSSAP